MFSTKEDGFQCIWRTRSHRGVFRGVSGNPKILDKSRNNRLS